MADPDTDHGFVYTDSITDIDLSPFFDVHPVIDVTVDGYIQRIKYMLSVAVEEHLGVYDRLREEYANTPLHPSYAALQTLYRVDRTPEPVPAADLPAMAALASSKEADWNAMRMREKELASVKINPTDVDIIANELELDKKVAERTLREHKGDAVAAIRYLLR